MFDWPTQGMGLRMNDPLWEFARSLYYDRGGENAVDLVVYAMRVAILATGEYLLPTDSLKLKIDRDQLIEDVTKHLTGGSK